MPAHEFTLSVYYEDTDLAGIVYYANYLKFIERARSTLLRERGFDQNKLKAELGIVFAVTALDARYHAPARMDDMLCVKTQIAAMTSARVIFEQDILRGGQKIFTSHVTVVAIAQDGKPVRLPKTATDIFSEYTV